MPNNINRDIMRLGAMMKLVHPNKLLIYYLIHVCCKYRYSKQLLDEDEWDDLITCMRLRWDHITHAHKKLVNISRAGETAYDSNLIVPSIARSCAAKFKEESLKWG